MRLTHDNFENEDTGHVHLFVNSEGFACAAAEHSARASGYKNFRSTNRELTCKSCIQRLATINAAESRKATLCSARTGVLAG